MVNPAPIHADTISVRIQRALKSPVAWAVVVATAVATGPTIWHDGVADLQTYLHVSRTVAMAIIVVPVSLTLLIVAFVRFRQRLSIRRQHHAARKDALRNLHV